MDTMVCVRLRMMRHGDFATGLANSVEFFIGRAHSENLIRWAGHVGFRFSRKAIQSFLPLQG